MSNACNSFGYSVDTAILSHLPRSVKTLWIAKQAVCAWHSLWSVLSGGAGRQTNPAQPQVLPSQPRPIYQCTSLPVHKSTNPAAAPHLAASPGLTEIAFGPIIDASPDSLEFRWRIVAKAAPVHPACSPSFLPIARHLHIGIGAANNMVAERGLSPLLELQSFATEIEARIGGEARQAVRAPAWAFLYRRASLIGSSPR
jgi:hypothetical protein